MTSSELKYIDVKGWHCVDEDFTINIPLRGHAFRLEAYTDGLSSTLTRLDNLGNLTVAKGYLWDGSSGPTIDGKADPVPSLVHDVLYEAMRSRRLHRSARAKADAIYRDLLIAHGMPAWRANTRWVWLKVGGAFAAAPVRGAQYPKRSAKVAK